MNTRQLLLTAVLSTFFTFTVLAGLVLLFDRVNAAPPHQSNRGLSTQTTTRILHYVSVSGLNFMPIESGMAYTKNSQVQLLGLPGQQRANSNLFVAPLTLPDRSQILGVTTYGEDVDNLGEVRTRLKRCNHGQPFCVVLAETTSTTSYALGSFETSKLSILNEVVDNQFYTYLLELDLTALGNSGLRSVRLELLTETGSTPPAEVVPWALEGNVRSIKLPNTQKAQVKICTDDLSHLNNITHYPFVVVDSNQIIALSSNMCTTAQGQNIEIRRELNTGPSSGTYQFLR